MRFAYCAHSHHRITGSNRFLLEALRGRGEVDEHWLDHWRTGRRFDPRPLLSGGYDAIVVVQLEDVALGLAAASFPNLTFLPMWDSCHGYGDSYWRRLGGTKVVCFSSTLHARLQRLGVRSRFVRYFPEPGAAPVRRGRGPAGYLWQRTQDVTWDTVRALAGPALFERFTLHDAIDPGGGAFVPPSAADVRSHRIRITRWHATRDEAAAELREHDVYFAPRLREGIGQSFLEAMALGSLVVAPDQPTMNEYIVSGVNGLLYDPHHPRPIDLSRRAAIGERARAFVARGRERWSRSLPALLDLIETPGREVPLQAPFESLDPGGLAPASAPSEPITVAVVIEETTAGLEETLEAVRAQDHPRLELRTVVLSATAHGPAATRNALAATLGDGYVVFLRPGDRPNSGALRSALRDAPAEAELVVGHHLARRDGTEELVRAGDGADLAARLARGELGWPWAASVPVPAATLWRASLLRRMPFREDLGRLFHEELLLRAAHGGVRMHHALEVLATAVALPESGRSRRALLEEWRAVAASCGASSQDTAAALERMRRESHGRDLHRLAASDLVLGLGRIPGAARELKRRVRAGLRRRAAAPSASAAAAPATAPGARAPHGRERTR